MILLFTDFGPGGPYVGQVKAVLERTAPGVAVIELMADAPSYDPMAAAYLLAALVDAVPLGSVLLAVVDPGVGSARRALLARIDGRWYIAPDNGLLEPLLRRAHETRAWEVVWRPERLSASFHGRDLFAPVAARLALGGHPWDASRLEPAWATEIDIAALRRPDWPDELARIIYIDYFGNAVSGLRAASLAEGSGIALGERTLPHARTFSDRPPGEAFWYENANGLVEIAVNQGRADRALGLALGSEVRVLPPPRFVL